MKHKNSTGERGYVLMTGAMMAVGLIACVGLAFDTGYIQMQKAKIQTAADSGTVAAVAEASKVNSADGLRKAARTAAARNGFVHGQNGVTVEVNNPPTAGTYASNARWIETVVAQNAPTFFMRMLGQNNVVIAARSVAKAGSAGDACVFALNRTDYASFQTNGNGMVDSCGIYVDSNNSTGAAQMNGTYTVKSTSFNVVGAVSSTSNVNFVNGYTTGAPYIPDPLWYVPAPTVGSCNYVNKRLQGGGNPKKEVLSPGVYCGGISVASGWEAELSPGVYILLGGGLDVATNASLYGTDVTIYNTYNATYAYKPITINGNNTYKLTAPNSGTYEGILMFQDRTAPLLNPQNGQIYVNYVRGASDWQVDGALYFKTQPLEIRGTSSWKYTIIVADKVSISGTTTLKGDYSGLANGNPMKTSGFTFGE